MAKWICGAVGLVLLAFSLVSAASVRRFAQAASRADAIVTGLSAGASHPRLRFQADDGTTVAFSGGGLIFGYAVGQRAPVLYRSGDAQRTATLAATGSLWFAPIMLAAIGLGFLLVPLSRLFRESCLC